MDCARKFKYLETFDSEDAWLALELYGWDQVMLCSFIKQLQNPYPMPGGVFFLLRKCNYLIQETASLVWVSRMERADRKLGLVPGELLALWKVLEGPE